MRDTRYEIGSALILAVVLTSLLAIVGVMFLMVARVDRMATSGISENKELNFAVETVIAKISQELVLDVPGVAGQPDYHDYPGPEDKWLASLEPYDADPNLLVVDPYWQHISDIYDRFGPQGLGLSAGIINDYQSSTDVGDSNGYIPVFYPADADGDGVSDSMWVELPDMTSSKGKPIYTAIRVIDNGGMLNVNTAYKFDPGDSLERIDGSSQTQINLAALSQRGANGTLAAAADRLQVERCGTELPDLSLYEQNVVWQYNAPVGAYTPFDISDELELRNRFLLNQQDTYTRIEQIDWTRAFLTSTTLDVPRYRPGHNINDPNHWFWKTNNSSWDANEYDYRHIGTTYNMDRIINPVGQFLNQGKMVNVNTADKIMLYYAIWTGLYYADPNFVDAADIAAQIAVNLKDYSDNDSNVSNFDPPPAGGKIYYGFERPCIYISELAHNFVPDPNDPSTVYRSYAIELHKPYPEDSDPNGWRLVIGEPRVGPIGAPIGGKEYGIDWSGVEQFYVIQNENPSARLPYIDSNAMVDNNDTLVFDERDLIELRRYVTAVDDYITVDYIRVPKANAASGWLDPNGDGTAHSIQRDIKRHKCIRRLWDSDVKAPTLGSNNSYTDPSDEMIQAHPENEDFTNIGKIGMIFREDVYGRMWSSTDTEIDVRLNLADPIFQQIFNYLTVFDPVAYPWNDPNETRIKGRININTAPWYVMAQLPWVSNELAQAIVRDRDMAGGFGSIGELNNVIDVDPNSSIDYYWRGDGDQLGFPDLTPGGSLGDDAPDDFEERDLIFSRISNLVTVRSDVFTAYILVRIGADGPQKRVVAIFDRSNVYSPTDKVKIVALHPVPDPR